MRGTVVSSRRTDSRSARARAGRLEHRRDRQHIRPDEDKASLRHGVGDRSFGDPELPQLLARHAVELSTGQLSDWNVPHHPP